MSLGRTLLLVAAGVGGGLTGSVAGLASLVSYPVLLALGLPPVSANVTNTVALMAGSVGSVSASRPELGGRRAELRPLLIAGLLGGTVGGAVLLLAPDGSFERLVPVLIFAASVAILLPRPKALISVGASPKGPARPSRWTLAAVALVGAYGGYFGAGAGVMMLALLLRATHDSVPRCNAVKNLVLGLANAIAASAFVIFGPVRWNVVVPLGLGLFVGGRLGPAIVRRVPTRPLRLAIATAGFGLAVRLAVTSW